MKTTGREKMIKELQRFGKKNRFCRVLAMPVITSLIFLCHGADYLKGNSKRLVISAMTFCLFAVYSSFSLPMFISENGEQEPVFHLETDSDVELASEQVVSAEDLEMLKQQDVLAGFDADDSDYDEEEIYDSSEVLAALEGYGRQHGDQEDEEEAGEENEIAFSRDDWQLMLINKQHSIPDDYTFTLASFRYFQCDERILDDLADMFQAAKDDGINLEVRSPYRTHDHQLYLFDRKVRRYMNKGMSYMEAYQLASQAVTIPGNSEHEVGLALDIECSGFTELIQEFGDTEAGKWLAENSYRYGFIIRYPEGKEYITGINYEPWHFRYVGTAAAKVITQEGITLEEFWEEYL